MPIYEYRCSACGFQHEVLQKMTDAPLTDCPECGKAALAKMVSAAGFQLKGSGWYATDFKNKSKAKTDAKSDKSAGGEEKTSAKADDKSAGDKAGGDKPAAKTETPKAASGGAS